MLYVADGPSDVPVFAVVKQMGGKTYAVYDPSNEREFEQTCDLVERSRVHNNGPADYRSHSPTSIWMKQKVKEIMRQMIKKRQNQLDARSSNPPKHLSSGENSIDLKNVKQDTLWK